MASNPHSPVLVLVLVLVLVHALCLATAYDDRKPAPAPQSVTTPTTPQVPATPPPTQSPETTLPPESPTQTAPQTPGGSHGVSVSGEIHVRGHHGAKAGQNEHDLTNQEQVKTPLVKQVCGKCPFDERCQETFGLYPEAESATNVTVLVKIAVNDAIRKVSKMAVGCSRLRKRFHSAMLKKRLGFCSRKYLGVYGKLHLLKGMLDGPKCEGSLVVESLRGCLSDVKMCSRNLFPLSVVLKRSKRANLLFQYNRDFNYKCINAMSIAKLAEAA